jgi:hypothetical protein
MEKTPAITPRMKTNSSRHHNANAQNPQQITANHKNAPGDDDPPGAG